MPDPTPLAENPFAVLSFLAAPAILTNAATVLVMSTSNRLARASDRARAASAALLQSTALDEKTMSLRNDFHHSSRRAGLMVKALRRLYLAVGAFAAAVCISLIGAMAGYFHVPQVPLIAQILTTIMGVIGVAAIVTAAAVLVAETRLALHGLADLDASIELREKQTSDASSGPAGLPNR